MNLDIRKCWEFGTAEDPSFPQIDIILCSISKENNQNFTFKVDTGFSGTLGINTKIIKKLNLEAKGSIRIKTAIGVKDTPIFPIKVKSSDIQLPDSLIVAIKSPRPICGRSFLKDKSWLLDFKAKKFCFLD